MKIFKIIQYVFLTIIVIIAGLLIISVFPITGNIKFMIVQSGSMEPEIKMGSVIIVKPVSDYKIGDVITFGAITKTQTSITHRIVDIEIIEDNIFYMTQGDANNTPDSKRVQQKEIIGKVLINIPYVGYAVNEARKPLGFILIVILPAMVIIGNESFKIFKEIKNK